MAKFPPPNVPFVEARSIGEKQHPSSIVLRASFTPSTKGSALAVAQYWHRASVPTDSCHYVIDSAMVYRCIPDDIAVQSLAFLRKNSIWINLCCYPTERISDWYRAPRVDVLDLAEDLVTQLCKAHRISPVLRDKIPSGGLFSRRKSGIIIQIPGEFPSEFVTRVAQRMEGHT